MAGRTLCLAGLVASCLSFGPSAALSQDPHAVAAGLRDAREALEGRRVTIDVENAPLRTVLDLIAQRAGLSASYVQGSLPGATRVTMHVRDVPASEAFARALQGTGLTATISPAGRAIITQLSDMAQAAGVVTGTVTDATTKRPIVDAVVSIDNVKVSVKTNANGVYRMPSIPAGAHRLRIRRLGYDVFTANIVVRDDAATTEDAALVPAATRLTEVVTTGSGDRRRMEIGNSVATINADSIVRTTPIRNLSDLLEARVPGVDVMATSGEVGSASTIRIRGAGSITSTMDPIVIVDGVRVNGGHKTGFKDYNNSPFVSNAPTTSPLNDIDPESIESIDILRGPSAAAMYGSDAANGVIVIKTKRGTAGPTRWDFFGTSATSYLPDTFPDNYMSWGQNPYTDTPDICTLSNGQSFPSVASGSCTVDSVAHFNPLNFKQTSPFAHGNDTQYGGSVSGGTSQMQYYLGANYEDNVGMLKLAPFDYQTLAQLAPGQALTDWQQRPNVENGMHVDTRLTTHVSDAADLAFSASGLHQYHRAGYDIGGMIYRSIGNPGYRDTISYGWGDVTKTPAVSFATLNSDVTDRAFGNLNGTWRPRSWLNGHATLGADHSTRADNFLQPRGAVDGSSTGAAGQVDEGTTTTRIYTGDFGAETAVPLTSALTWRSSVGSQLNKTQFDQVGVSGQGLAYGSTTTIGATTLSSQENHATTATIGWYGETGIALAERLFATVSVRNDRGSTFANGGGGVTYPKFNVSWLASQEPIFRRTLGQVLPISNFRLRAAYGQAGVQPDVQAQYLTYSAQTGNVNGTQSLVSALSSLGNAELQPERSLETEGGFDLGMWNDRLTVEATVYRKVTKNALVLSTLPPSFGSYSVQYTTNVGRVDNHGVELSIAAQPIVSSLATWNVTFTYSANTNKLIKGSSAAGNDGGLGANELQQRYVPGYPIAGFWDRPILGYADVNGDGIIELSEIELGDSAVYLGAPYPKADMSLHQTLSLWSGRVSLGVGLDIRDHFTQYNGTITNCYVFCRGLVDPTASFAEQVVAQEALATINPFGGASTQAPFVETISWVRLNELSLTYTLPQRMTAAMHARNASVSLMGRNLALWTKYRGADPEVNTNAFGSGPSEADLGGVPQPREWSLRLNLGF